MLCELKIVQPLDWHVNGNTARVVHVNINVGHLYTCVIFLGCWYFCRHRDKNWLPVFNISQEFHNSCGLLILNLGLNPAFVIYITFLFSTSVGFILALIHDGGWGSAVVKALRYKSVGPGIDSERWRLEFILWQLTFPCALGSTQPLKMSTGIFLWVKAAVA